MKPIGLPMRSIALALAIPVGATAISYACLIDSPLRTKIGEAQVQIAKLNETIQQREAEHSANLRTMEEVQQSRLELEKLVSTILPTTAETSETIEVDDTDSPLTRLTATVALFDRYQLVCLGSQVIELSNVESKSNLDRPIDQDVRLTLLGTFGDMHRALAALRSAMSSVAIMSLDMETSPPDSKAHQWSVILRIEGR